MLKPGYYATHPHKHHELSLLHLVLGPDRELAREAAQSLIVDNKGFLKNTLLDWSKKGYKFDFDELLREAMTTFYEAILRYDTSKDISIRTYARYHLLKLRDRFFSKQSWKALQPEHDGSFEVRLFSNEEDFHLASSLSQAVEQCLTPVEKEVIYLYFFKGLTKRKVGQVRGCSERRIGVVIDTALPKLKSFLLNKGIDLSHFATN